jgi:hypothetical protein
MAASPLKLELSRKQTQIDQYKEQAKRMEPAAITTLSCS